MPVTNADLETVLLATSRQFLQLIGRSRKTWETGGGLSASKVRLRLSSKKGRGRKS